jgi:exosortase N
MGCFVLPFTLDFTVKEKSNRWFVFGILFLVLSLFIPSYTLFYLALVGCVLGVFENIYGKQTLLPFLILITISPIFRYLSDVFTFDIRLILTEIAAKMLRFFDPSVFSTGNVIQAKGQNWQIDEACMGLNMLGLSFILTCFFISILSKEAKKRPIPPFQRGRLRGLLLTILLAFLLNTLANLIRIFAVVYFKILPGTQGHEAVGLLSLACYNLLPVYFFVKKSMSWSWFYKPFIEKEKHYIDEKKHVQSLVFQCVMILFIVCKGIDLAWHKPQNNKSDTSISMEGFKSEKRGDGVIKLSNDSVLIYVKNLNYFFTTEHSPMICWKGSGYTFQKIEKMTVDSFPFYTGILQKGDSKIYAAWWFESDNIRTIEQMTWRKEALIHGKNFKLININAESQALLLLAIRHWILNQSVQK